MRLVIDTDVLIAAMRSPMGASAALLVLILQGKASMLLSVAMAIEYEAACTRSEQRLAAKASEDDITDLLDAIFDIIIPIEVHYQWRPQLSDPNDEIVLEAAVNGHANAIVTFNNRHYKDTPSKFGIEMLSPSEALRRIRK